ncbi:MAG: hypothetical protein ACI4D9_09450 [Lachnospiraceae bacterium]
MSDEAYNKLISVNQSYNPYELYLHDTWAYSSREKMNIFTKSQIMRLKRLVYYGDVVDSIEVDGIEYNNNNDY